ncbi:hypothetical protein QTL97_06220 [Sporosarcina thermotolerans]|uniref:Uncharacterized protein n=1 Tax=Sporosarcina thermotolerans TaxID=633404 RepID=A0AAW9A5P3_9BACL|nr:hypothetical protein [Sporosarcina thermotolerans]MDW0116522.1 hypothetical protein [Sporosarcina thermotolerans]WHT48745.1 hypothetical protein QNH10_03045 [Sporosarcina thermotolerans]
MEQETMLKEILSAFKLHAEHIDKRFEEMDKRFEQRFEQIDKRFDRLEMKVDGIRLDLTDTQKTTNFLLGKVAHHEEKFLELSQQKQ